MALWFVEIRSQGDDYLRYIPVNANTAGEASVAAQATGLESFENIGTIASRQHFEARGVKNLPLDSAAITYGQVRDPIGGNGGGGGGSGFANDGSGGGEGFQGNAEPVVGGGDAEFGSQFRAGLRDRNINLGGGGGIMARLAEEARRPFESRAYADIAFNDPTLGIEEGLTQQQAAQAALAPSFQEMVRTGNLFGGGAAQQARDLLTQAQGFSTDLSGQGVLAGNILNPRTAGEGQTLANIAREGGRQRFGSFARFLPGAGDLSEGFFAQPASKAQTFADYLNQRIFG